jgi:hypothetical protein
MLSVCSIKSNVLDLAVYIKLRKEITSKDASLISVPQTDHVSDMSEASGEAKVIVTVLG